MSQVPSVCIPIARARPVTMRPIAPSERIQVIDVLRGFALLGVLLVNMEYFVGPTFGRLFRMTTPETLLDAICTHGVRFLAESKFYTMFSFLFGYGAAVQMARAAERGISFPRLFARKQVLLAFAGMFHLLLFWLGDILLMYGVLGLTLGLCFRSRTDKTLIVWAGCLAAVPALIVAAICLFIMVASLAPEGATAIQAEFARGALEDDSKARQAMEIFAQGPVRDILARRIIDLKEYAFLAVFTSPNVLAYMLLGFLCGRRRWFHDPAAHARGFRRLLVIGLLAAIPANLIYTLAITNTDWNAPHWTWVLFMAVAPVAGLSLAGVYASLILWAANHPAGRRLLSPLAAVGRTALTNYLMHSVICTTIVCSYGFGLYGRIRPPTAILLTVGIYVAQILISNLWLRRFRFGPAEWAWRSLTYGKRQPMRRLSVPQEQQVEGTPAS